MPCQHLRQWFPSYPDSDGMCRGKCKDCEAEVIAYGSIALTPVKKWGPTMGYDGMGPRQLFVSHRGYRRKL